MSALKWKQLNEVPGFNEGLGGYECFLCSAYEETELSLRGETKISAL